MQQVLPACFSQEIRRKGLKEPRTENLLRDRERRSTDGLPDSPYGQALETILRAAALRPVQNKMAFFKAKPLLPRAAATASLLVLVLLVLVPCAVLFSAVTLGSGPQAQRLLALPAICWAIWANIALWAALDSSKLWRTLGRRVEPLGSYGVWDILLGVLNVGASLLAVVQHRVEREARTLQPGGWREPWWWHQESQLPLPLSEEKPG
jgi:hypothetical protein